MTEAELLKSMARAIENAPKSKQATAALAAIRAAGWAAVPPAMPPEAKP